MSYFFLAIWLLGIALFVYLLFFSQNIFGFIVSLFVGYIIAISMTMLPQALVIIVYEASLNILDRDPELSQPGFYLSFYELICEQLGLYGEDMRLSDWITL